METKLYKQQPKKIPETERLTQECSVSALWVKRAECFTAFLAVLFSLLFGLFSYPLCLRFHFILCTTTILFQPFHILTFHSAFCDPVFCPGRSLTHVDVLNRVTFFFCYFASFAPQGELPLLQPIKRGLSTVIITSSPALISLLLLSHCSLPLWQDVLQPLVLKVLHSLSAEPALHSLCVCNPSPASKGSLVSP